VVRDREGNAMELAPERPVFGTTDSQSTMEGARAEAMGAGRSSGESSVRERGFGGTVQKPAPAAAIPVSESEPNGAI